MSVYLDFKTPLCDKETAQKISKLFMEIYDRDNNNHIENYEASKILFRLDFYHCFCLVK